MRYFKVKVKEEIEINDGALLKVEKNTYKIPEHIYCPECQNPPEKFYSARPGCFYLDDPSMDYNPTHKQYKCKWSSCRHTLTAAEYVASIRKGKTNLTDEPNDLTDKEN